MSQWIEWKGGECPVPADTTVEYRMDNHDGTGPYKIGEVFRTEGGAGNLDWKERFEPWAVTAYRVVPSESSNADAS